VFGEVAREWILGTGIKGRGWSISGKWSVGDYSHDVYWQCANGHQDMGVIGEERNTRVFC
jgi:hypothetical protein